jgi:hypothetical protein
MQFILVANCSENSPISLRKTKCPAVLPSQVSLAVFARSRPLYAHFGGVTPRSKRGGVTHYTPPFPEEWVPSSTYIFLFTYLQYLPTLKLEPLSLTELQQ